MHGETVKKFGSYLLGFLYNAQLQEAYVGVRGDVGG